MRDEDQAEVLPGFTVHGMDVGKWLAKQRKPEVWQALTEGQRERLSAPDGPACEGKSTGRVIELIKGGFVAKADAEPVCQDVRDDRHGVTEGQ